MKLKLLSLALLIVLLLSSTAGVLASPLQDIAGLSISADKTAKSGQPGSVISYKLTLSNSSLADLALTGSASTVGGWPAPTLSPASLTVPAGGSATVSVNVPIPASATNGQNDIAEISFSDGANSAAIQLKTSASTPTVSRPLIRMKGYSVGGGSINPGQSFKVYLTFENIGKGDAAALSVTFTGTDFLPQDTGGVITTKGIPASSNLTVEQPFLASESLWGQPAATVGVTLNYSGADGTAYTEAYTLSINLNAPNYSGPAAATATPTATARAQVVVSGYKTSMDPLQPGTIFDIDLEVRNLGSGDARSVTMVLGGGVSMSPDAQGTPQPGVSGTGSDLTNFAPLGSSNLVFLGDIPKGSVITTTQKLIVNVNTQPGAYSLKLSFVYTDPKGTRQVDDQVITLLVYSLPMVEVNFYRDPGVFFAGQMNVLPLQVTNLGRKQSILGNMKVTIPDTEVTNNVALVGVLDPGGYFTLDSNFVPVQPGQMEVTVTINYTDDFNQPRSISQSLTVDIQPQIPMDGGQGGPTDGGSVTPPPAVEETLWDKVLRFFKGLFGLDSGAPVTPSSETPTPEESNPIIRPGGKG